MKTFTDKNIVLVISTIGSFIIPFTASAMNIALRAVGTEYALSAVMLNWIGIIFLLVTAMFTLPFGRIGDIYGRKKVYLMGMILFTIANFLCAITPSANYLIAFRALQGIGGAMLFSTGIAMLTSVYPANERGRVLGITVAAAYIGLSVGPFIGGLLTQHFGWRSIFIVSIPVGFLSISLIYWKLRQEWADAKGESFDLLGAFLYSASLLMIVVGFSEIPKIQGFWGISVGIVLMAAFVYFSLRSKSPLIEMAIFKNNKILIFSNLAALISYSAVHAVSFLLSLYLQYIKEFTPTIAGLVLVIQPVFQASFSPFAGKLSDRVEPRIVASVGMGITTLGLFVMLWAITISNLFLIAIGLCLLGFGFALFSSPNTNAIMGAVEKKHYGIASGVLATMRQVGQNFSMGIVMIAFVVFMGKSQIVPSVFPRFIQSIQVIFLIMIILCFLGVFASLFRGKVKKETLLP